MVNDDRADRLSSTSPFQKFLDSPLTPYVQQIKWYFLGMKLDSLIDAVQFIANYTRVYSVDSLTTGIMHVMQSVCCHCQFVVYLNLELLMRRVVSIFSLQGRHVVRNQMTVCPSCQFPAIMPEFIA